LTRDLDTTAGEKKILAGKGLPSWRGERRGGAGGQRKKEGKIELRVKRKSGALACDFWPLHAAARYRGRDQGAGDSKKRTRETQGGVRKVLRGKGVRCGLDKGKRMNLA